MTKLSAIPTNILTGFLGAGKTSAILHLLQQKPVDEYWAVLVNEFGEIGVDGSLFQGQHKKERGVFIREVPGGCMCCAAGIPMQVALNALLSQAQPDRLLIEPTGLGHPQEVLQTLSSGFNKDLLSIQQVVTLVDARQLSDSRYTEHTTFNQQIEMADVVVGNKQDLYGVEECSKLEEYVQAKGKKGATVVFSEQGAIDLSLLDSPAELGASDCCHSEHNHHSEHSHNRNEGPDIVEPPLPESGVLQAVNQGEGYHSVGWRFSSDWVFDRTKLYQLFYSLEVERMKAVFITTEGIFGFNLTGDGMTEIELQECIESRIEIITDDINDDWQPLLFACRV